MTIQNGIDRLLQLRQKTREAEIEMVTERARFDAMRENGPTRAISSFNLFQTPPDVARQMAAMIGPTAGKRVLEPSAGLGALYNATDKVGEFVFVEQSAQCCAELYRLGPKLIQGDFLETTPERLGGLFDLVLMNPPFKMGTDIKHTRHALNMLKPGGQLVGLCFDGVRQNKILKPIVDSWEPLPADSFKSEGTRAGVVLITIRKPLN